MAPVKTTNIVNFPKYPNDYCVGGSFIETAS